MSLIFDVAFSEENLYAVAHLGEFDVFPSLFVNLNHQFYKQSRQYHNQ